MRIAHLKVVHSSGLPGMMSIRGPKGRGQGDDPHKHITEAGFQNGEAVVLISKAAFDEIYEGAGRLDPEDF